tara:strand:+ start:139 stop:1665 length:1527 start_codon:yes stop_codon:yes gene_type:complete
MRELGDTQLPATGPVLTNPRNPRNTGLFQGYGGNQNILEREGADPSDLKAAMAASDMPSGQDMVDEATPENISELIDLLKALGVIAPEFDPNSLGGAGQTPSLEEMYARLLDMYNNAVGVQYGDPGGAGTGSDDSGTGTGPLTDDDGNLLVDGDGNLIFGPIIPGVTVPNFPLPPSNQNNEGDDDAGGGGGSGGEEGGEAGASDDGGGDAGGSDSGGDAGGEGGGGEGSQQFYEVDEDGNVFIVDYEDEDGFFDENGFWQGDFKRIGNLNDDVDAWWKEIFQPGGTYDENGGLVTSPEDDPDSEDDDDDDDGLAADPDLFGGSEPTDPGPPITGGPNPPSVGGDDGGGTFGTDPNTGEPQTGGPQPPGGDGGGGDGATDDGTDTGGGGDDTGGGGGGSDGGGGGGDGGGDGTGGDDGSGGDGSGGEGEGGDGSGSGSGGEGSGDGLGGDDLEFDPDKLSVNLPFVVPDLYDVPQQRGMFLSQIGQPDSILMLDDFFVRQMNRKGGMLV